MTVIWRASTHAVLDLFPDMTIQNLTPEKQAMTVRDVLMMAPGLDCDDLAIGDAVVSGDDARVRIGCSSRSDLPMTSEPGSRVSLLQLGHLSRSRPSSPS